MRAPRAGLVRDGHGDLRLEHILLGERVDIVDCVEFEPALRRIDVAADLAFALMELHEAGRADLAEALVRAYRAAGGDPGSDALLAFFAAYRAEVRAKVALLRAEQRGPAAAEPDRAHAQRLLALAARLRWRAHAPLVIAVAGVSASGKSTVARQLAAVSGFPVLSSDLVRKTAAGLRPTERAPVALYADDVSRATYAALGAGAAGRAATGVIADATFRRRADRDAFRAGAGARRAGAVDPAGRPGRRARAARDEREPPTRARLGRRDRGRAHPAVHRRAAGRGARCGSRAGARGPLAGRDPRRDRGRRRRARVRNPPRGKCRGSHAGRRAPVVAMLCAWTAADRSPASC